MSTIKRLFRPTLFTAGVCGICFCGAAIAQHKRHKTPLVALHDFMNTIQRKQTYISHKYLPFRQEINKWTNQLTTAQKIAGCTIFVNTIILACWHSTRMAPVMMKFFTTQASTTKIQVSPMLLSCFSHGSLLHLAANMITLSFFAPISTALLGPEQLIGFYISAGVVSSLSSISFRMMTRATSTRSHGASGALMGVIAYCCTIRPDDILYLLVLVPIPAGYAIKTIMAIDLLGIIAKWRLLDHAAHIGGSLFGIWYAKQGELLYHRHKAKVVDEWRKLRDSFD